MCSAADHATPRALLRPRRQSTEIECPELAPLVEEIQANGGEQIIQTANVTGDSNVTTQIAGSGNVVR